MNWGIITLPKHADSRGWLAPCEFENLPFVPVRAYWLHGKPNEMRGQHAHHVEHELFVCLSGSCTAEVEDTRGVATVQLDSPNKGIYIPTYCWHQFQDFSEDCVLLALASTPYMPGDANYITDRTTFRNQWLSR